jgi:predicted nucleic acid-binding protein
MVTKVWTMNSEAVSVVIADTSCLILLKRLGELDLLHAVFGTVTITDRVRLEFGEPIPEWVIVESPKQDDLLNDLMATLDPGEATAIALAAQRGNCLLVLDDLHARRTARQRGILFIGTLGVLTRAKASGVIKAVAPYQQKLVVAGFRATEQLFKAWLEENGEFKTS